MRKERHPVFWLIMLVLLLVLALGVVFLVQGLMQGPDAPALLRDITA